ncbi:putative podospora anserina S mat+ genomic DNA chromosome supercontig 6 [Rosellinia necatrix]|uniref:Putative podospora anserina S mat+ genomic DNA chromosome supercontig 6 n=1 Tax=Rosellinia necatrix TaxID=77044 RepID=A0A1W2TUL0_ROSNE|nr:putative podospora anserina S mat+ genomic DNA chromosome supercontig 6 [Rosellinia necatrix]
MSAELGLAIIGAIDIGLKYGNELRKICSALNGAESEIAERSLRLDDGCYRCIAQLQFLRQIQHVMDDGHRELQERTLRMLIEKLTLAKSLLRSMVTTRLVDGQCGTEVVFTPKAVKYAFRKEKLDRAIEAFETWQRLSDPSWFLIFKIRDAQLENTLKMDESIATLPVASITSIRAGLDGNGSDSAPGPALALPAEALGQMDMTEIALSCCTLASSPKAGKATTYILESVRLQHPDLYQHTKRDIRNLARRLQHDEPQTFGLLNCKGFISERPDRLRGSPARFTIVSRTPAGFANPRSLRDLLLHTTPDSLSEKFLAAQELAKAVAYVHVFGFVHKGIRPESILSFEPAVATAAGDGGLFSSLFLVGFEDFRKEDGRTRRLGDCAVERNLYRHPSRQGATPSSDFAMQHDIYSLGVCLLEIGLWQSLVEYDGDGQHPAISPLLGVPPRTPEEGVAQFVLGSAKAKFIDLARTRLPRCMGTRYSDIVETCLSCLDPENSEFGDQDEFEDADGVLVGVRYIEKILHRLDLLCV